MPIETDNGMANVRATDPNPFPSGDPPGSAQNVAPGAPSGTLSARIAARVQAKKQERDAGLITASNPLGDNIPCTDNRTPPPDKL